MVKIIFRLTKEKTTGYLLAAFLLIGMNLSAGDLKLRYDRSVSVWEEAMPLGNSRLGVMVYGIPDREELQLNEETIWGGGPYPIR